MALHRIRRAVINDLPFLLDLERQCFPDHRRSSRQGLKTSLKSHVQEVYILELMQPALSSPAGAVVLLGYKRTMRIYSLAMVPQAQGTGLGTKLLNFALERAAERGFERVSLEADSADSRLIGWYRSFGFQKIAHLPDYYAPGEDAFRMAGKIRQLINASPQNNDLWFQELSDPNFLYSSDRQGAGHEAR